jgi:HlyD family secretion protein
MKRTYLTLIPLALAVTAAGCSRSDSPAFVTAKAARHEIRVLVSTNGIIEPADRSEVYAPIDGFVASIQKKDGAEIAQGQPLLQLHSEQLRTALAEASAALLAARRQARAVEIGPSKEEIAEVDASIAETALQLEQQNKDLAAEEALYAKQAATRMAVENLRKQRDLLQLRMNSLKQKRQDLQARYSSEDKAWEQDRIAELTKQVDSLKRQLLAESVAAPQSGLIYSLQVKQGSFVSKGQLLAQVYKPGKVMLRAYVDEPDLGRIRKGQQVRIEWDGMPNQQWTGVVEKPAEQVVAMNNRSVGEVLCSIEGGPPGLIPNLNVRVEITTELKANALVVPRNAVFNRGGKPSVLAPGGKGTAVKPVELGLATPEEIEILRGICDGDLVILNPAEAVKQ